MVVSNIFYLRSGLRLPNSGDLLLAKSLSGVGSFGIVMAKSWGAIGSITSWSVSWDQISIGTRIDVVAQPVCLGKDGGLVTLFPCGSRVRIIGLEDLPSGTDATSIFGAMVETLQQIPVLRCDEISLVMHFPAIIPSDFRCMTEVCAGAGIATYGFAKLGIQTVAANEYRPALAELFRQLHDGVPVTVGDVALPEVVHDLWLQHGRSTVVFGGFACQPFSRGGQQQGANDLRAGTLSATLKAGFMLRAPVIYLECVPEAASNCHVRHELANFCRECCFHMSETLLALDDCWVSRRSRWWVVLTAKLLGTVALPAPPTFPFPSKVLQVLPRFLELSADDLSQLQLEPDEMRSFIRFVPNLSSMALNPHGKAPTALHSWGSQVVACHCGCRKEGFNEQLLMQRGIYGVLAPCEGTIEVDGSTWPAMRHLHPVELALLTCVPTPSCWPGDLRLGLCALGQQATPLQSLWIAGMTLSHVDRLSSGTTEVQVWTLMEELRQEVLLSSKTLMQPEAGDRGFVGFSLPVSPVFQASLQDDRLLKVEEVVPEVTELVSHPAPWRQCTHQGQDSEFTKVDFSGLHQFLIPLSSCHTTVQDLVLAEMALSQEPVHIEVCDCVTGNVLHSDEIINGRALLLVLSVDKHDEEMEGVEVVPNEFPGDGFISPTLAFHEEPDTPIFAIADPCSHFQAGQPFEGIDLSDRSLQLLNSILDGSPVGSDPLCRLQTAELSQVAPPPVSSMFVLDSLCKQEIPVHVRLQILGNQAQLWSDDEIRFHIRSIIQQTGRSDIGFIDPLLAAEIIRRPNASLLHQWIAAWQGALTTIVTVVWIDGHWIPLCCTWTSELLHVSSWDNTDPQPRALTQFCDLLSKAVGASKFMLRVEHSLFSIHECCGVCAVRFVDNQLRGRMLPTESHEVKQLHLKGRAIFLTALVEQLFVPRPWLWGNGLDVGAKNRLQDLLSQHGVGDDQMETRIHLIVQSVGVAPLQSVLLGSNPWRSLKSLANACKPPVQLVLAEELQLQVDRKMKQGSIGKKTAKKKSKQVPKPPAPLDPLKLAVDAGVFVRDDGSSLRQLSLAQIGPFAEGIVIANMASASAYLRADQVVNKLALGMILVDAEEKDLPTRLKWQQIRVALRCAANGEPMLMVAYLIQLGEQEVAQAKSTPMHDLQVATVSCLKAAVYRDAIEGTWESFCRSPIRYLIGHLPPLQPCETCEGMQKEGCPCWHSTSDDDLADPILDVWRRQWLSLQFRPVSQEEASLFIVNLRIVHALEETVLRISGHAGIYLEPRTVDSREPHLDYQVLWMPRANHSEIERLCRTNPLALGVARLGSRFGLRVLTKDASTVGQQIKPGSIFLASGTRLSFEVGPLPFGFDRLSLSKIFTALGWQARPLHTVRTLPGVNGAVWLVHSCVDPPKKVLTLKHGDVVITKLQSHNTAPVETLAPVVTSSATLELCQVKEGDSNQSALTDPWLVKDPWTQPIMKMTPGLDQSEAALKQVEARVEQTLMAKIPSMNPNLDIQKTAETQKQNDVRFQAIESQLQQLSQGHQVLENRVEEQGRKHEVQLSQFQHQVSAQMEAQSSQMESLFRQQMASIEDLLSSNRRSRSRHE